MRIALILLSMTILLATTACEEESPSITEETYMNILTELELIHVFQSHTGQNARAMELIEEVWVKYQISEEDFLSNHFMYEKDVDAQIRRIQTITEKVSRKHLTLEGYLGDQYLEDELGSSPI